MNIKTFPLSLEKVKEISKIYPTPFVIYDKKAIIENAKKFYEAFSWCS
jgi:diaminopimelate decarboxylase